VQVHKNGKLLDTRWVPSSCRTVNAVLANYTSLAEHFHQQSQDTTRNSRERSKFTGLLRYLQSTAFVRNLSLMADALEELSQMSKDLQSTIMTMVSAHRKIHRLVLVFEAHKTRPRQAYIEATKAVERGESHGTGITDSSTMPLIDSSQFYQSLADNLKRRMLTTASEV